MGKLKSQEDKACFAEQKGGFYLSDRREPVDAFFLGSIVLMAHDSGRFSSPSSERASVLSEYSVFTSSRGLPRHLISNLVS